MSLPLIFPSLYLFGHKYFSFTGAKALKKQNNKMLAARERSDGLEVSFLSPRHGVIIFLITTFGGYLQFQHQSEKKSLLEEHRQIMIAIYVNLFMYGVSLMAEFKLKTQRSRCLPIVEKFTLLSGILVVVLITIVLSPELGLVALVLWALIALKAVIELFQAILQWLRPMFTRARAIATSWLLAFVISALVTLDAVIKLFVEILQWLRPIFIGAREIVTSYCNGFAGTEENDLARENGLPV